MERLFVVVVQNNECDIVNDGIFVLFRRSLAYK